MATLRPSRSSVTNRLRELPQRLGLISASLEYDVVLNSVVRQAAILLDGVSAVLLLRDGDRYSLGSAYNVPAEHQPRFNLPNRPEAAAELQNLDPFAGLNSCMVAPLVLSDETVGLVAVYRSTPGQDPAMDHELLVTLGSHAAIAIENARLFAKSKKELSLLVEAVESLKDNAAKYLGLALNLPDGLLGLDCEGNITFINPIMANMLDYPAMAIEGRPASLLVSPSIKDRFSTLLVKTLREGRTFNEDLVLISRYGSPIETALTIIPVRLASGQIDGAFLVARDITEHRQMQEQLLRNQRLEMAGSVVGQVAHDFNNLLGPLVGFPELIKSDLPPGHPAAKFCDIMVQSARQMADINADLLALGRRGHFDLENTDLNRLIQEALDQVSNRNSMLIVEVDLAPDLMPVKGAEPQLLRVLSNLLTNAREAMQDVGLLLVKTRNVYMDKPFGRYNRVEIGEYVRLEVLDNGCGIPAEIRDKIFDPFFTTKRSGRRRGLGLGLSVAQAIIADHHGYIDVESEAGKGARFSLYLPVCREEMKDGQSLGLPRGSETVLVVDDDKVQQEVASHLLESLGYQVAVASSGDEALSYLKERPIDLLVLDMVMPGSIDGADTFRRAMEIRPNQRAIVVSGFPHSERVREAQGLGAGPCLSKPVTLQKLARAIRDELDRQIPI